MFEPNRGGNLWCGVQSQRQEDGYEKRRAGPFSFALTCLVMGETVNAISCFQMKLLP